jgi:hypothetical protein
MEETKYLTVEEALRGWLNGETLQTRAKGTKDWACYGAPGGTVGIYLSTDTHEYRFKPKPLAVYAVFQKGGSLVNAFEDVRDAEAVASYQPGRRVVRMVEPIE